MNTSLRILAASISLICASHGVNGYAQSQTYHDHDTGTQQPQRSADGATVRTLDEITVTVQKKPDRPVDVPMALTVLPSEELGVYRRFSPLDLDAEVPGLTAGVQTAVPTISLRGVGGGGRNIGFDPRVGIYLDGIYLGEAPALVQPVFGLDHVAVLRGPNGHLFGRNSVAGALVLNSQDPSTWREYSADVQWGSDGLWEWTGTASGPLAEGWSGSVGLQSRDRNGDLGFYNTDRQSGRVMVKHEGSEWTLKGYADRTYVRERNPVGFPTRGFFGLPWTGATADFSQAPLLQIGLDGVHGVAERATNWGTFTAIIGQRTTDQRRQNDTDYSSADLVRIDYAEDYRFRSQEFRLAETRNDTFNYVVGAYFSQEQSASQRFVLVGQDMGTPIRLPNQALLPFGAVYQLQPNTQVSSQAALDTHGEALFFNLDMGNERWKAGLGGRWDREHKRVNYALDGRASGRLGIAYLPAYQDDLERINFSPAVSLSFRPSERQHGFIHYGSGVKSGGWNVDVLSAAQVASGFDFDTETSRMLEAGWKWQAPRYDASVIAYRGEFKDFQVFQFVPLGGGASALSLRNAAKVVTQGAEAEGRYRINDRWTVSGFAAYNKARFEAFPDGGGLGVDLTGNTLPDAPRWMGQVASVWTGDLNENHVWRLHVKLNMKGSTFTQPTNRVDERLPAEHLWFVRWDIANPMQGWEWAIWANDVGNDEAVATVTRDFFGHVAVRPAEGRTVGTQLIWRW